MHAHTHSQYCITSTHITNTITSPSHITNSFTVTAHTHTHTQPPQKHMVATHTVMATPSHLLKSHLNDFCVHFIPQCTLYPTVRTLSHSAHTIFQNAHFIPECAHFIPQCTKKSHSQHSLSQSGHFIPQCTSYPTVPTLSDNAHILYLLCFLFHTNHTL